MKFNTKNSSTNKFLDKELIVLLNRIKNYYQENVTDLCCYTERRIWGDTVGAGLLKYKKGDKYRREFKDNLGNLGVEVCDGKTISRYEKEHNRVFKAPLNEADGLKFSDRLLDIVHSSDKRDIIYVIINHKLYKKICS